MLCAFRISRSVVPQAAFAAESSEHNKEQILSLTFGWAVSASLGMVPGNLHFKMSARDMGADIIVRQVKPLSDTCILCQSACYKAQLLCLGSNLLPMHPGSRQVMTQVLDPVLLLWEFVEWVVDQRVSLLFK